MPKIQNKLIKQNLAQFRVWIEDTEPNSRYFQISQLPDVLTGGKNAFLIAGAPELVPTTEVKMELIDANGNTIFLQPIKNYAEGLSRVVSIEVYEDTPPGPAILTILGQLRQDANGNTPPTEFAKSYNVRFQKQFVVSPRQANTTLIRLFDRPALEVSELLVPFRSAIPGDTIVLNTGSIVVSQIIPNIVAGQAQIRTVVQATGFEFDRNFLGGKFATLINGQEFSSSIASIYSKTTAQLSSSFAGTVPIGFSSTNFSITYVGPTTYSTTALSRSFADIHLAKLTTFSGDIARAKIYVRSLDQPGDYQPVTDIRLEATELTLTQSIDTGQQDVEIGDFLNQATIDAYWQVGSATTVYDFIPPVSASYDSTVLLDAALVAGATSSVFFGTKGTLPFVGGLEYTFTGSFYGVESVVNTGAELDVYLVGEAFPATAASPLGQLIGKYVVDPGKGSRRFDAVSFNFTAPNTGDAALRFVLVTGDWRFSGIGVFSANETGFNPDEVTVLTPIVGRRFEHLQFKAELYDVNNNLVPVIIESIPDFFDGGNYVFKGTDHRVEGSLNIIPSGSNPANAIRLQATGFSKGSQFQSGSAIVIGSGSFFDVNTPFLVGSSADGKPFISISDKLQGFIDETTGNFVLNIEGDVFVGSGSNRFDVRSLLPHNASDHFFDRVRGGMGDFEEVRATRALTAGDWNNQFARMGRYTRGSTGFSQMTPVTGTPVSSSVNPFLTGSVSVASSGSIFVPSGTQIYNDEIFGDITVQISDGLVAGGIYSMTYQVDVATKWGSFPVTGSDVRTLISDNGIFINAVGDYSPDPLVKYPIPIPDNPSGSTFLFYRVTLTVTTTPQASIS
jgi:hypothetical protein